MGEEHRPVDTRLVIRHSEYSFRQLEVKVVAGPDQGDSMVSEAEEFAIGTDEGNALVLSDATVSRHHCELVTTELGLLVRDLGSTNGTILDGVKIEAAYARAGSSIQLGDSVLRVDVRRDEVTNELPRDHAFDRVLGVSAIMRRIFSMIERIAASDSTILLEGETGTGKTLLAETIHAHSRRAEQPFVVVDCSAIPPTLIESELFGHERGAFTGAHSARPGAFASAHGGTIFLDEIGELPLGLQPKLLRVFEEREVKRIGSNESVKLDIRLIAATNRDLRAEVNAGTFRSDLYYRLNTVRLRIPALRERKEDIPQLVAHFYRQYVGDDEAVPPAELVANMVRQPWKGNIRELRSAVERAVLLGDADLWRELTEAPADSAHSDFGPPQFDAEQSYREAKERSVAAFERWYVAELVQRFHGNLSKAARTVRMDRNHLRDLCRKHDIDVPR